MRNENKSISRRNFVKKSATMLSSIPFLPITNSHFHFDQYSKNKLAINLFSKHLQFLNYNEMAATAAEIGFDGLDLTVRPNGHVLPERVGDDLPKAVEAMTKYGLNSQMMTTNVWDIAESNQRKILQTASELGFSHYRTGWLAYPEDRTIPESQVIYSEQARDLAELNKSLGLIGCYQKHAGNHVGAPIWDLPVILPSSDNEHLGCQYDIRHAIVEGGKSWELDLRRIEPFIRSIVIKDFKWGFKNGKWQPINTPLGDGMVDFKRYFSLLKRYKINVPISLHLEYDLGGAEHGATEITMNNYEVFAKMKKDLSFIKETWQRAE